MIIGKARSIRLELKAKSERLTVRPAVHRLFLDRLALPIHQARHDGRAAITRGADVGLHRHRRILKGALGDSHLLHGNVAHRIGLADDDWINRRQPRQVRHTGWQVGRVSVRQEEDAGEWTALEAILNGPQRRTQSRRATVEGEFMKVRRGLQPSVEHVAPHIEGLGECRLPAELLKIEELPQAVTAAAIVARVMNLQSLAVVGDHGEEIDARARPLAEPQGFQQAEGERQQADDLQREANPPQRLPRRGAVTPRQDQGGNADKGDGGPKPVPTGEGKRRGHAGQ